MENKAKSAFRGTTQLAYEPADINEPDADLLEIDHQEDVDTAKLASLRGNPGWELIKKDFEETIARYRSGRVLQEAVKLGKTNAELGELTRTCNIVADELEKIVNTVEAAAVALEDSEAEESDGRRSKPKGL